MSARLFAALELPGDVRAALASWGARVSAREQAVRLVPTESLHVTLVFLGAQDDVEAIGAAVASSAGPVGPLAISEAAWLPPRRPGVLVADLRSESSLTALHERVVAALAPWHEPEERAFRPHVTVARVRSGERIAARSVPEPPRLRFAAAALVLYRSHPGSRYEPVVRVAL